MACIRFAVVREPGGYAVLRDGEPLSRHPTRRAAEEAAVAAMRAARDDGREAEALI